MKSVREKFPFVRDRTCPIIDNLLDYYILDVLAKITMEQATPILNIRQVFREEILYETN